MRLRYLMIGVLLTSIVGCSEAEKEEVKTSKSPEYNMLAAADNIQSVWSVDLMNVIEDGDLKSLQLGGFGMMVTQILEKLSDPKESGMDFTNRIHYLTRLKPDGGFDYSFSTYQVHNRAKVYPMIKGSFGLLMGGVHDSRDEFDTYFTESGVAGAWDDTHMVVVFAGKDRSRDELIDLAIKVLNDRNIDAPDNPRLTEYLALEDDLSCLINLKKTAELGQTESDVMASDELIAAYNDGFVVGKGNFDDGEMVFTADVDAENLKQSEFNAFGVGAVSQDLLDFVTTEQSVNVGGASLRVDQLFNLIKEIQYEDESILKYMTDLGITESDLKSMLTGEVAFSVVDLKAPEKNVTASTDDDWDDWDAEESYTDYLTDMDVRPEVIMGLKLKSAGALSSLLKSVPASKKQNGLVVLGDFFLAEKGDKAIITTSEESANALIKGSKTTGSIAVDSATSKMPAFVYFNTDYDKYPEGVKNFLKDKVSEGEIKNILMMEGISGTANFDHFEIKLVMKDKSQNALKVFVNSIHDAFFPS